MARRAPLVLSAFFAASLVAGAFLSACGPESSADPSYVIVELVPAQSAPVRPHAARVVVSNLDSVIATLCINIDGPPGLPIASFALRRDPPKSPLDRIQIDVSAYDVVSGQENVGPGKEFTCPAALPPILGNVQNIDIDFCEAETRRLVFHVGAVCDCVSDPDAGTSDAGASDAGTSDAGSSDAGAPDAGAPPCGCGPDLTCGAGLSSAGQACGPSTCCATTVTTACALDS